MAGKSIDDRKKRMEDIGKRVEEKKSRLGELEQAKAEAREQRMALENNFDQMDDSVAEKMKSEINEVYESVSNEGKELSSEMTGDIKELDNLNSETAESLEAAKSAQNAEKKLVDSCKEHGIIMPESRDISDNVSANSDLLKELQEKKTEASNIASKLGMLWSEKLDAGTGSIHSDSKKAALQFADGKSTDSNGDAIQPNDRSTWDYGHYSGFEKRHLEAFASMIELQQSDLSNIINSTLMIEIQNRESNRNHEFEETDFSESMRQILMASWDHLPEHVQNMMYIDANQTDIIFEFKESQSVMVTPTDIQQIKSERAKKAFAFDIKIDKKNKK